MAILFNKGDVVKVTTSTIQGPVLDITMNADYVILYLVGYTNAEGVDHKRWFKEPQLSKV